MPEGDTVFLAARRLSGALDGRVLERAELRWPGIASADLTGATVLTTEAYGKHMLTRLDTGWTLHSHLRMDGSWRVSATGSGQAAGRGPMVRAVLGNAEWTCVGNQLGMLDLVRTRDESVVVGHLGPDILAEDFLVSPTGLEAVVRTMLAAGSRPVAETLLDQRVVAGIGTLFAAEGLFALQMWPWAPCDEIDLRALLTAIRRNLVRGVLRPVDGRRVHVHSRAGSPCPRCRTPIVRGLAGAAPTQRPMFFCPQCQRPAPGAAPPPAWG